MVCFPGQCREALALIVVVVSCPLATTAQDLLQASFGGGLGVSTAFVVGSGKHVVSVGVAGRNLAAARLSGLDVAPVRKVVDPVSRVVVFEMPASVEGGAPLASQAPAGGLLRTPGGALGARIEARVERIEGKFLPFTLLKLGYDGSPPEPGTPLLDAKGAVAAIAYEGVGAKGGYALPVEVLHRVLDEARQGKGVQRAWIGLILNPASGQPKVTRTVDGSPANRAGVQVGDLLVEVGGRKVVDYGDAVNAFFLLRPGEPTSVKVNRGGAEKMLDLVPAMARR